jgi:hypothetical protein
MSNIVDKLLVTKWKLNRKVILFRQQFGRFIAEQTIWYQQQRILNNLLETKYIEQRELSVKLSILVEDIQAAKNIKQVKELIKNYKEGK